MTAWGGATSKAAECGGGYGWGMTARRIREPGIGLVYELRCDCFSCRQGWFCEDLVSFIVSMREQRHDVRFTLPQRIVSRGSAGQAAPAEGNSG